MKRESWLFNPGNMWRALPSFSIIIIMVSITGCGGSNANHQDFRDTQNDEAEISVALRSLNRCQRDDHRDCESERNTLCAASERICGRSDDKNDEDLRLRCQQADEVCATLTSNQVD